jgi:hypothetical protein
MASPKRFAAIAAVYQAVRVAVRPGGPSLGERAGAFPRLVRAAITGEYTGISKGRLALMVVALAYIVSPLDLIPEFVMLAGLADDALVMAWLATQFVEETEGVPGVGARAGLAGLRHHLGTRVPGRLLLVVAHRARQRHPLTPVPPDRGGLLIAWVAPAPAPLRGPLSTATL